MRKLTNGKLLFAIIAIAVVITTTAGTLPVYKPYDFHNYIRVNYIYAMDAANGFYLGDLDNLIPVKNGKIDGRDIAADGEKLDIEKLATSTYDTDANDKIDTVTGGTNMDSSSSTGFAYVTAGVWSFLTPTLNSLSDVTITTPAVGDIQQWNGTTWINITAGASGTYLKSQGTGASLIWDTPAGAGDMATSTYDPAGIAEQLAGLTATQLLSNKQHKTPWIIDDGLNNYYKTVVPDLTTDININLPLLTADDTPVFENFPQTLTNKDIIDPTGLDANDVGLDQVDNTSDATKNAAVADLANKSLISPIINVGSDADGDLYTRNGGVFVRIAKGTTGHILKQGVTIAAWEENTALVDPMTTIGDIIVRDATNTTSRLGIGTNGKIFTSNGTVASWEDPANIDNTLWTGANWTSTTNGVSANQIETTLEDVAIRYADRASQLLVADDGKIVVAHTTGSFTDDLDISLNAGTGIYTNNCVRNIIEASKLSINGDEIKILVAAATTGQLQINSCYIGHKADTGNAWDFDGTQVPILFAGSSTSPVIEANTGVLSDAVTYSSFDPNKDLIISFNISSNTALDNIAYSASILNVSAYNLAGGDPSATVEAGYAEMGVSNIYGVYGIYVLGTDEAYYKLSDLQPETTLTDDDTKLPLSSAVYAKTVVSNTIKVATSADQTHTMPALSASIDGYTYRIGKYGQYKLIIQPANTTDSIGDSGDGYGIETLDSGQSFVTLLADNTNNKWHILENTGRWAVEGVSLYIPFNKLVLYAPANAGLSFFENMTYSNTSPLAIVNQGLFAMDLVYPFTSESTAPHYDGSSGYSKINAPQNTADMFASLTDDWTLSVMVKFDNATATGYDSITNHYQDASNSWQIYRTATTGVLGLYVETTNIQRLTISSTSDLLDVNWHQIDLVKVGPDVAFYIDGAHENYATLSLGSTMTGGLFFGMLGDASQYFDGSLSDFFLVNQNIYNVDPTDSGSSTQLRIKPANGFLIKE